MLIRGIIASVVMVILAVVSLVSFACDAEPTTPSITEDEPTAPTINGVLFSDSFSDEAGVWDIVSNEYGSVFYENGWLHLINYTPAPFDTYSLAHQHFTDFILEVETKLVDGSDDNFHSVAFRFNDEINYYIFGISADGYYLMSKWVNGNIVHLAGPASSSYISQGQDIVNLIRIECIGSNLSLSVNGQVLASVTDSTFTRGDIALFATPLGVVSRMWWKKESAYPTL